MFKHLTVTVGNENTKAHCSVIKTVMLIFVLQFLLIQNHFILYDLFELG